MLERIRCDYRLTCKEAPNRSGWVFFRKKALFASSLLAEELEVKEGW